MADKQKNEDLWKRANEQVEQTLQSGRWTDQMRDAIAPILDVMQESRHPHTLSVELGVHEHEETAPLIRLTIVIDTNHVVTDEDIASHRVNAVAVSRRTVYDDPTDEEAIDFLIGSVFDDRKVQENASLLRAFSEDVPALIAVAKQTNPGLAEKVEGHRRMVVETLRMLRDLQRDAAEAYARDGVITRDAFGLRIAEAKRVMLRAMNVAVEAQQLLQQVQDQSRQHNEGTIFHA